LQQSDSENLSIGQTFQPRANPFPDRLSRLPWWALAMALLGILIAWGMLTDETYHGILTRLSNGVIETLHVTLVAYALAIVVGLLLSLARLSTNALVYQISTFYVEIVRGVPTLVLLLWVAFVMVPLLISGLNSLGAALNTIPLLAGIGNVISGIQTRDVDNELRVIVALMVAYSAFLAEIFRAGIEAVDRGQMEAARALGMTYWQAMRHVILRQAIRQVLPPLGNDFIAMLKDSSLVSVLGVPDLTQLGRVDQARTFMTLQTYNVVAFLYLAMTLMLSMGVKLLERRMSRERTSPRTLH
jgi:polar amino acid transport system permease protein